MDVDEEEIDLVLGDDDVDIAQDGRPVHLDLTSQSLHTQEINNKRAASLRDPEVQARASAAKIQTALEKTIDGDLLERTDFTKTSRYAVRCMACDANIKNRCDWSTHCKNPFHKEVSALYRKADKRVYEFGHFDGRFMIRCNLCIQGKKPVTMRIKCFETHDALPRHQKALQMLPAETEASHAVVQDRLGADASNDPEARSSDAIVHLRTTSVGYGFSVSSGARPWSQVFDYFVTDFKVAKEMAMRIREITSLGRTPTEEELLNLRTTLDALKDTMPRPIYNARVEGSKIFVIVVGCSPPGLNIHEEPPSPTAQMMTFIKDEVVRAGHGVVIVSVRFCGDECKSARISGRIDAGFCINMSQRDLQKANTIIQGVMKRQIFSLSLKDSSKGMLSEPHDGWCKLQGNGELVIMFAGSKTAACLSWKDTARLQEEVAHAYMPHVSQCNRSDFCEDISESFQAFGGPVNADALCRRGKEINHKRLHSDEVEERRLQALQDPAVRARMSAAQIKSKEESMVDGDLYERVDFSKSRQYRVRCKACDREIAMRSNWTGHCKTNMHEEAAIRFRAALVQP